MNAINNNILKIALRKVTEALDDLAGHCLGPDGEPQRPPHKALMRARGCLPPWCKNSLAVCRISFEDGREMSFGKSQIETSAEVAQLRAALARCLREAEWWLDEARGCKPEDVMGYDGWADEARALLLGE